MINHQRKESQITNLRQITLSGTLEEGLSLLKLRLVKGRSTRQFVQLQPLLCHDLVPGLERWFSQAQ